MPHGSPASVSSGSVSDSSSASTNSLRGLNFDPHAVYPFTDCSVDSKNPSLGPSHPSYAYRYGPTMANYDTPHVQHPSSPPSSFPPSSTSPSAPPPATAKPSAYPSTRVAGIFVPFRKETASPDLSEILKNGGQGRALSFQSDSSSRSGIAPGGNAAASSNANGRRN